MRLSPVLLGLAGLIGVTLAAVAMADGPSAPLPALAIVTRGVPAAACSLTPAQERAALDAFDKLLPVIHHPRCANCHGGVNPFADPQVGRHFGGNMLDSATGAPQPASVCQDCHSELPGWDVPGSAMFFVGRSARDLCMQFKQFAPSGPAEFITHVTHEAGPQFIATAFLGTRALNTLGEVTYESAMGSPPTADPPPGGHPQLIADGTTWANAIGTGWNESPECGCELSGSWDGTITAHAVFVGAGMPGTLTVTSSATVVLEPVPTPSYASGRRVRVYHATGGIVRWDALASGACRGQNGGTVALDTTDINGNPMLELRTEENASGGLIYQPTTGSQPDLWSPIFNVQCVMGGTPVTVPTTNLLPTWWHYDIPSPPTSTDPDVLEGSYRWVPGPGSSVLWKWKLTRIR